MATTKKNHREIEDRYATEDKEISQERSDFLLPQVLDFVRQKQWLNLQPEYQRRQVWDKKKKSQFIESLLMNLPIPPVFLFEYDYNRYEVMDGQQRLSSITSFYSNEFKLSGLDHWKELNGKIYSELPPRVQRGLDRRRISAVVLQSNPHSDSSEEIRRIVFERLNTGGQKLNAQELRNCVYSGTFSSLLVELAGYPPFNDLWEIPRYEDHLREGVASQALSDNPLFKRMIDCEIVLRFFAFRNKSKIKGSVKSILDQCMSDHQNDSQATISKLREDFTTRIDLARKLFGLNAFKLNDPETGESKLSTPFYDAIMIACDRQYSMRTTLIKEKRAIRETIDETFAVPDNYELSVGRANTSASIKERLDLMEACFLEVI